MYPEGDWATWACEAKKQGVNDYQTMIFSFFLVTNERKHVKESPDHRQRQHQPHAAVNLLSVKTEGSGGPVSLQVRPVLSLKA